ncbi:hypothetical protein SS50377_20990 [Spironucleus salmonicida]|uniref:Uncharacterized protein n=1 Tax=Spironucleus salmonicida TaxID=348837 RepID=V6LGM5_9EUKA|nr:hypothetical protein SS50377_20990 [Spironucleus salmonicida]|eukprot:EST43657.1 Hypothetical protein SS50377_16700 [Spironucleus salmonicida]
MNIKLTSQGGAEWVLLTLPEYQIVLLEDRRDDQNINIIDEKNVLINPEILAEIKQYLKQSTSNRR